MDTSDARIEIQFAGWFIDYSTTYVLYDRLTYVDLFHLGLTNTEPAFLFFMLSGTKRIEHHRMILMRIAWMYFSYLFIKSSRGMLPTRGLPSRDVQFRPFHLTKSRVMDILSTSWTSQTPQKLSNIIWTKFWSFIHLPGRFFLNPSASQHR